MVTVERGRRENDLSLVRQSTRNIPPTRGYRIFSVLNTVGLLGVCAATLYPFINLVAKAFSSEGYIAAGQVNLWPRGFTTTTFVAVMGDEMFWTNYKNTVVYTAIATSIAMILTTTFAYALSKRHLVGRGIFTGLAVFTMFFSGGLIPNYLLIDALGFKNTIWAIVVPNGISVFNLLIMKSFFENFPPDLEEAGAIDGLTHYGIFARIVLPLSKAVIATIFLFYAVAFWNSWFQAFLYLDRAELYPVTIYLRNLLAAVTGTEDLGVESVQIASNIQAVTMVLTVLPILCVYPIIQRYFVSGVMLGSVKG